MEVPTELDRYTLVILRRPPDPPQMTEEEQDDLQVRHALYQLELKMKGIVMAAGPFDDRWDESFRGMTMYKTGLEETRRIASDDPSVVAGRLTFNLVTWMVPKGQLEP